MFPSKKESFVNVMTVNTFPMSWNTNDVGDAVGDEEEDEDEVGEDRSHLGKSYLPRGFRPIVARGSMTWVEPGIPSNQSHGHGHGGISIWDLNEFSLNGPSEQC